ncbi:MAG TPA: hypothetical protein QF564_18265 [Pirellulaceae bacterium]|nr:hypothetical protein [Pirellulaceae bacterium]
MNVRRTLWTVFAGVAIAATGCSGLQHQDHNLPPAERLMSPGPGVGGPGPGVIPASFPGMRPGMQMGPGGPPMMPITSAAPQMGATIQLLFHRPEAMQVRWDVSGVGQFDSDPMILPGRKNFPEGGIFRLKLTGIPGREGVELYPTLEVGPTTPRTAAYLAHNAIPIQFTEEDFDQVLSGNFVTKVIYLPDPEFQEMALAGVETLVSTRLDPGVDPIVEADRRGSIMAVIRLGNKDVEMPGAASTDQVMAASFNNQPPAPLGAMLPPGGGALMSPYVSGVTAPQYGMPMTGTPIGLPGPPHIPLGAPAGFQRHVINNHTRVHMPGPTEQFKVNIRQRPGYSYPKPPSHMSIREQNIYPSVPFTRPNNDRVEVVH